MTCINNLNNNNPNDNNVYEKYIKYKNKYLNTKNNIQVGGSCELNNYFSFYLTENYLTENDKNLCFFIVVVDENLNRNTDSDMMGKKVFEKHMFLKKEGNIHMTEHLDVNLYKNIYIFIFKKTEKDNEYLQNTYAVTFSNALKNQEMNNTYTKQVMLYTISMLFIKLKEIKNLVSINIKFDDGRNMDYKVKYNDKSQGEINSPDVRYVNAEPFLYELFYKIFDCENAEIFDDYFLHNLNYTIKIFNILDKFLINFKSFNIIKNDVNFPDLDSYKKKKNILIISTNDDKILNFHEYINHVFPQDTSKVNVFKQPAKVEPTDPNEDVDLDKELQLT